MRRIDAGRCRSHARIHLPGPVRTHVMRRDGHGRIGNRPPTHASRSHGRVGIGIGPAHGRRSSVGTLLLRRLLLLLSHHHDTLFGTQVLLFTQLTQIRHDFRSPFAQTLRSLGICFFIAHVIPNGILFGVSLRRFLVFVRPRQKSSRRIHLSPELHHFAGYFGLVHFAGGQITQFVLVDQFAKLDIAGVIVGAPAASQQDIVVTQFGHVNVGSAVLWFSCRRGGGGVAHHGGFVLKKIRWLLLLLMMRMMMRMMMMMNGSRVVRGRMIAVGQRASHVLVHCTVVAVVVMNPSVHSSDSDVFVKQTRMKKIVSIIRDRRANVTSLLSLTLFACFGLMMSDAKKEPTGPGTMAAPHTRRWNCRRNW